MTGPPVVRTLPSSRGAKLRVCGADAVRVRARTGRRGWTYRVVLLLHHDERGDLLRVPERAPYRDTRDEAMADLPCVAWGADAPVYDPFIPAGFPMSCARRQSLLSLADTETVPPP